MPNDRDALTNPSRTLREILPAAGRRATVLVLAHGRACAECAAYIGRLQGDTAGIEEWDGRVVAVRPAAEEGAALPELVDPAGRVAAAAGVAAPAVVVVDQWGEVHVAEGAGEMHAFLEPDEVVGWLRWLATRCPECEGEAL